MGQTTRQLSLRPGASVTNSHTAPPPSAHKLEHNPKCYGGVRVRECETLELGDSIRDGEQGVLGTKNATLLLSVAVRQDWRLQVLSVRVNGLWKPFQYLYSFLAANKTLHDSLKVTLVEGGDLGKVRAWEMPPDAFSNRVVSLTNTSQDFLDGMSRSILAPAFGYSL